MPASPSTTTAAPVPRAARSTADRSAVSSARRPTSAVPTGVARPLAIPLDLHRGRAAEADDRGERVHLVGHEPQARQRGGELLQHHAGLQPREWRAEAVVRAVAEREVLARLAPMETSTSASAGSSTPDSSTGRVVRRRQWITEES